MKFILIYLFVHISFSAYASKKVDNDLERFDTHINKLESGFSQIPQNPNDKKWVKEKLIHMVEVDQYTRNFLNVRYENNYNEDEVKYFWKHFESRWKQIDHANTEDLKSLLKKYTWFHISKFGRIADGNAWLIVQHADHDPYFQKEVLATLTTLWPKNETNPSNYAYLYDRVAASWQDLSKRKLQRYGTQGKCVSKGAWEPIPIEDPNLLNERRQKVGLPPFSEYLEKFKEICKGAD